MDPGRVGRIGEQSQGKVLLADEGREEIFAKRRSKLATAFGRDWSGAEDCLKRGACGMRWVKSATHRFRSLFRKNVVEHELDQELRFHLERQIAENAATGMRPEEARHAAMREFGGVEKVKEECRDERRVNRIETFSADLRYGLRSLRKSPGFTAVSVLTLT